MTVCRVARDRVATRAKVVSTGSAARIPAAMVPARFVALMARPGIQEFNGNGYDYSCCDSTLACNDNTVCCSGGDACVLGGCCASQNVCNQQCCGAGK